MNLAQLSVPAIVCAAAMSAAASAEPIKAVRGLAARVEVDYAHRLRAREDQTPSSPILVRVSSARSAEGARQVIEFIGAVAGEYDLRDHVAREDGQPITDLASMPVTVVSRLPADHGVDLYATTGSWMNWRANYREIMWVAVGVWVLVPIAVVTIRAARRARPVPPTPAAPPPPSVADQLRAALEIARERPLTVEESGRLELLLLRYLGGDQPRDAAELVSVLRDLRADDATSPIVIAIERWLHAQGGGESGRADADAALDNLRATLLKDARSQEVAV